MASGNEIVVSSGSIVSERESFDLSGPLHLTTVDWSNPSHRRSIAACLVQSVYILERDRQEKREGSQALAPPWWKKFNFTLYRQLIDDTDSCIFGAIFQLAPTPSNSSPRYVIAFRGTITKGDAFLRDLELDIHIVRNGLHQTSRFEAAIQAVRQVIATFGSSSVWLAGHSLGAAMSLLAGKNVAKNNGIFLDAYLFNPPFFSAPIELIKDKKVKHGLRFAGSIITAGLALAMKNNNNHHANRSGGGGFDSLSAWLPFLFVNPADHICSEYVGYFEHRKRMEEIGAGNIERLATQHSIGGLLLNVMGKASEEPLHLIPSASVSVNLMPARDLKEAHGIHQWWSDGLNLETKTYNYSGKVEVPRRVPVSVNCWRPLEEGTIKLNSDEAFKDSLARGGGVIRDSKGEIVVAFHTMFPATDNLVAEVKAMAFGINIYTPCLVGFAGELGWMRR